MISWSPFAPHVMSRTQTARYPCVGNGRLTCGKPGGRYWDRTSDLFGVNKVKSGLGAASIACWLVTLLALVGLRGSGRPILARSSPRFLPATARGCTGADLSP